MSDASPCNRSISVSGPRSRRARKRCVEAKVLICPIVLTHVSASKQEDLSVHDADAHLSGHVMSSAETQPCQWRSEETTRSPKNPGMRGQHGCAHCLRGTSRSKHPRTAFAKGTLRRAIACAPARANCAACGSRKCRLTTVSRWRLDMGRPCSGKEQPQQVIKSTANRTRSL